MEVGALVKVVKIIETPDKQRNDEKRVLLGCVVRIRSIDASNDTYDGHVYRFKNRKCSRPFHLDELERIKQEDRPVVAPQKGDFVRVIDAPGYHKVVGITYRLEQEGQEGQPTTVCVEDLFDVVSKEDLALQQYQKKLLMKQRDDLFAEAKAKMDEAMKVNEKINELKN